jgi:hypothetical protein
MIERLDFIIERLFLCGASVRIVSLPSITMTAELEGLADRGRIWIEEATRQYNPDGWIVRLAIRGTPRHDDAHGRTRQMPYVGAKRPRVTDILQQMLDFAAEVDPNYRQTSRLPKLATDVDPFLVFSQARTDMRMLLGSGGYDEYMRASCH